MTIYKMNKTNWSFRSFMSMYKDRSHKKNIKLKTT